MILNKTPEQHHKHALLPRPTGGEYGHNELAILGAPCSIISQLASRITSTLSATWKIAYLDADHAANETAQDSVLVAGGSATFTNKISHQQIAYAQSELSFFQKKTVFNNQDLLLINGNHFTGSHQIVIIDPAKTLEKKLDKLTNVQLILLKDEGTTIPDYLQAGLPGIDSIPKFFLQDTAAIAAFVETLMQQRVPLLNGLVLTGGKSLRMGTDKGSLQYHGLSQKQYVFQMLSGICQQVFVSVNEQHKEIDELHGLQDRFTDLGPMGGILTALQSNPDAAWLVVACDLPLLTQNTLQYLIEHRNPSKAATAFYEPNGTFPEPLITIWEPRSYSLLLQALAQGYSCPRKVLIHSDVEMLQAPDAKEFENVNTPAEYQHVKAMLQTH